MSLPRPAFAIVLGVLSGMSLAFSAFHLPSAFRGQVSTAQCWTGCPCAAVSCDGGGGQFPTETACNASCSPVAASPPTFTCFVGLCSCTEDSNRSADCDEVYSFKSYQTCADVSNASPEPCPGNGGCANGGQACGEDMYCDETINAPSGQCVPIPPKPQACCGYTDGDPPSGENTQVISVDENTGVITFMVIAPNCTGPAVEFVWSSMEHRWETPTCPAFGTTCQMQGPYPVCDGSEEQVLPLGADCTSVRSGACYFSPLEPTVPGDITSSCRINAWADSCGPDLVCTDGKCTSTVPLCCNAATDSCQPLSSSSSASN